jgi:quercetin dioxygenase-like cupin family protein
MRRIAMLAILGSLGIIVAVMSAGTSLATAPSGAGATFTYRASVEPYHFDSNDYKIFQKNREDVVMRQITIAPGGDNGWHFHPGPSFVIVTQGTLSLYEANDPTCTAQRFAAGDGFVEVPGDVHIARNEGTVPVVALVTFLDVPVGGAFRLDATRPGNCPF